MFCLANPGESPEDVLKRGWGDRGASICLRYQMAPKDKQPLLVVSRHRLRGHSVVWTNKEEKMGQSRSGRGPTSVWKDVSARCAQTDMGGL